MIEVENLTKRYGNFVAIDKLNFTVDTGEILGFLGLNAAGKTTTMRVLTCYFLQQRELRESVAMTYLENPSK